MTGAAAGLVVFDLDGTLVDSATDLAAAVSALTGELGGRRLTRSEVIGMVGEGAAVLVRRALTAAGVDPATPGATHRFLALYDARLLDTTCLYPGMRAVLDALDPLAALAVLTNKPAAPAERMLAALGVREYFIEVVGGDGPWPRKPDPAGLVAPLSSILAAVNVSIYYLSTYNLDYILVAEKEVELALNTLTSIMNVMVE